MNQEEDLQKMCLGLIAQFQASGAAVILVFGEQNTFVPGILCDMQTIHAIAASALKQGQLPANSPSLEGVCAEICSHFGCSHAIVLVMFHETRTVFCSSNCPAEISMKIMGNLVQQPQETV